MEKPKEFSCTCYKYSETMDVVMAACAKHRKAAIDMKEIAVNQKKKIEYFKNLTTKMETDIENLESEIRERCEFATKVVKQRDDLEKEMKFLVEKVELKNEDIVRLEFKIKKQNETSQKLVRSLIEEKSNLEKDIDAATAKAKEISLMRVEETFVNEEKRKMMEDINNLILDIDKLRQENANKDALVQQISQENCVLHGTVKHLEETNESIRFEKKNEVEENISDVKSLEDELTETDNSFSSSDCVECKECGANFICRNYLKKHMQCHVSEMRIKLIESENKMLNEQNHLTISLIKLKQKETKSKREPCVCKGYCGINHIKHNWKLTKSENIYSKLAAMKVLDPDKFPYPCNHCDEKFDLPANLEEHITTKHPESQDGENGGSID